MLKVNQILYRLRSGEWLIQLLYKRLRLKVSISTLHLDHLIKKKKIQLF